MTDTLTHSLHALDLNDSIIVRNVAPVGHMFENLTIQNGPKVMYQIPRGGSKQVPYAVVKMHFGDVRSAEEPQVQDAHTDMGMQKSVIPPRKFEVNRLHVLYGLHLTQEDTFEDVKDRIPQIELEFDGLIIPTVFDDPLGKNVVVASQTVNERDEMRREIQELRELVNSLKDQGGNGSKITRIGSSGSKSTRVSVPETTTDLPDEPDFTGTLPTDDVDD